jgi:hypothetical protein
VTYADLSTAGIVTSRHGNCDCYLTLRMIAKPWPPVLHYGRSVTMRNGLRLTSRRAGMLLAARNGHGFLLTPAGRIIKKG